METPSFPSNNNSDKVENSDTERPPAERVVEGRVVRRRRSNASQIGSAFSDILTYIAKDVVLPATKDILFDAVTQGTDRALFGESRGSRAPQRSRGQGTSQTSHVSYQQFSTPSRAEPNRSISRAGRAKHNFEEIVLETRFAAEDTLNHMYARLDQYGTVTVADLYQLVGISGKFTDDNWGWVDLDAARSRKIRDGFVLELPTPIHLD